MIQLTLESGRVVQRVFCGYVKTVEDLQTFYKEMQQEIAANANGEPLLCEIWKDATASIARKRKHKEVLLRNPTIA